MNKINEIELEDEVLDFLAYAEENCIRFNLSDHFNQIILNNIERIRDEKIFKNKKQLWETVLLESGYELIER